MKRPNYYEGRCLDNTKTPSCRSYFKYRVSTDLECARAERKAARRRPKHYRQLQAAAKDVGKQMRRGLTQALRN